MSNLGWTDERVEVLKKLWADGLSCSQIARQLGCVTRNAVIGKVHRLGLSGREAPAKPARIVFKAPRPVRPVSVAPSAPRQIARAPYPGPDPAPPTPAPDPVTPPPVDEAPGMATVLTLSAHMCKWPIGDPSAEGFTFCGRRASGKPYCPEHSKVAYQPAELKKRKPSANELARSLRRYL